MVLIHVLLTPYGPLELNAFVKYAMLRFYPTCCEHGGMNFLGYLRKPNLYFCLNDSYD